LTLPLRQHGIKIFEYNSKVKFCFLLAIFLIGCGSAQDTNDFNSTVSTQAPPFINRVNPTSGSAGATITLFGFGFSSATPSNVIMVGGTSTSAATYGLVSPAANGEIEQLTFTIPAGATAGAGNIFVTVFENSSNGVAFTINP